MLLLVTAPSSAQDSRTMEFSSGARQNELDVKVEYADPYTVDPRLADSLVLPVRFEVRNVAAQPVAFNYRDLRLNLGTNLLLAAVGPDDVSREILRMRRVPGLLRFLGGQSTAFQPSLLKAELEKAQLKDGDIRPGQTKAGYVFFIRPAVSDPSTLTG